MKATRFYFILLALAAFGTYSLASGPSLSHVYISQYGTGTQDGSSCANSKPVTFFNNPVNWGTFSGQIAPGTTVHLCGVFSGTPGSTMLTTQGNGTIASPIKILAEPNTIFESPAWSTNGAIYCNNDFIILDGGSDGIIRNVLNGDGLSFQNSTCGIRLSSTSDYCTVTNWNISNLYVKKEGNASTTDDGSAITGGGSNIFITNNTIDHIYTGINYNTCGGTTIEISNNTISFCSRFIAVGLDSTCTIDTLKIHDNIITGGSYIYDNANNDYRHSGISIAANDSKGVNPTIENAAVYNNYIHGIFSRDAGFGASHTRAWILIDDAGTTGLIPNVQLFNNVLVQEAGDLYGPAMGYIAGANAGTEIFNNTIVGDNDSSAASINVRDFSSTVVKNNIFQKSGRAIIFGSGSGGPANGGGATSDYNLYYDLYLNGLFGTASGGSYNWTGWQTAGYDANSQDGNDPMLDASYQLQPGSAALASGTNLSSLGISLLKADKSGNARPAVGPWDIGAFQNSAVGIKTVIADNSVSIYPNPASDKLFLSNANAVKEINLITLQGEVVLSESNSNLSNFAVDLHQLADGIYFVLLKSVTGTMSTRKISLIK